MSMRNENDTIVIYASPECCRDRNLCLYKSYFNVAWFVRAYADLLQKFNIITTDETRTAILEVENKVDKHLTKLWDSDKNFCLEWEVPFEGEILTQLKNSESVGSGFEAQVKLAARVASGEVDRFLMFQDPDDVQLHLPEAYALIRNCTLADVPLNINAGATIWAESESQECATSEGFGDWRGSHKAAFRERLQAANQRVAFIAHDEEKGKMCQFVHHFRDTFKVEGVKLTGTVGTCKKVNEYLRDRCSPWEVPTLHPAGSSESDSHGPTGGDVIIAEEIINCWPEKRAMLANLSQEEAQKNLDDEKDLKDKLAYKTKNPVRREYLTHTVIFFIDHLNAQPHQADIHVLLRTCLHPSHGVNILLNDRTAREWAEML